LRILLREDEIRQGVRRMAEEIRRRYADRPLTIVGILTGSVVLLADLIRLVDLPLRVGVIQASSYRNSTAPGPLAINLDVVPEVAGRDVLLVDDIFDSGQTLQRIVGEMQRRGARSIRSAVLLRKDVPRQVAIEPDFVAFEIPNEFVVGYGLDYRDAYRNLPYVAALGDEEIEREPD